MTLPVLLAAASQDRVMRLPGQSTEALANASPEAAGEATEAIKRNIRRAIADHMAKRRQLGDQGQDRDWLRRWDSQDAGCGPDVYERRAGHLHRRGSR